MKESLVRSLRRLPASSRGSFDLSLVLNGPSSPDDFASEIISTLASTADIPLVRQFTLKCSDTLSKISVVNDAAREAKDSLGLIVVDDDIIIPPQAFSEMMPFLLSGVQHDQALCFPKTSYDYAGAPNTFASDQQFLLHPCVQKLLVRAGIFEPNRRACGSLYAIHRSHLNPFPNPCNEADIFKDRRIQLSEHYVRTWYPPTFAEEVARRRVHVESDHRGPPSPKRSDSSDESESFESLMSDICAQLPSRISKRICKAMLTMRSVFHEAGGE